MYSPIRLEARVRWAGERGSCSGTSLHAIPESTSDEGYGSRLPWLPSDIQQNSVGGGPSVSIAKLDHPPDQRVGDRPRSAR